MSMKCDYVSELQPQTSLLCIPQVIYEYGDTRSYCQGKPNNREKACPSITLSTITNIIWSDPDANPDLRTDRLATNSLSHRMVYLYGKERGLL